MKKLIWTDANFKRESRGNEPPVIQICYSPAICIKLLKRDVLSLPLWFRRRF